MNWLVFFVVYHLWSLNIKLWQTRINKPISCFIRWKCWCSSPDTSRKTNSQGSHGTGEQVVRLPCPHSGSSHQAEKQKNTLFMTLSVNNTLPVNFGKIMTEISIINYLNIHISMRDIFRITKGWLGVTGDLLGRTSRTYVVNIDREVIDSIFFGGTQMTQKPPQHGGNYMV